VEKQDFLQSNRLGGNPREWMLFRQLPNQLHLFPASSIESTILIGLASFLMFIWWILIALKLLSYRN
jgi:hypothetical protein